MQSDTTKKSKLLLHAIAQGFATLLSRISGLIRDILTAHYLGAGSLSDAFFISFRIPNMIRKLIGEGPLSASFTPIFMEKFIKNKKQALEFGGAALVRIMLISFCCALPIFIFMPTIVEIIAPGIKNNPYTFNLTVTLSRIGMPFMVITCIVAILGGIMNSMYSFFVFGITPLILNLSMILCSILLGHAFENRAFALSIGIVVGGLLQVVFILYQCKKLNALPIIKFKDKSESTKHSLSLFTKHLLPIIFGQGIFQINMFIDGIFASFTPNMQSYLYYSDRLIQFAVTLIGHTFGTVSLPMISKLIKQSKAKEAGEMQDRCILWSIGWSVPATASLFTLSSLIISLIYKRGLFGSTEVHYVSTMLQIACISVPFLSINRILYSSIYAIEKIKSSVLVGIVAVVVNLLSNLLLMKKIPYYYVAVAGNFSAIAEFAMLCFLLKSKFNFLHFSKKSFRAIVFIVPIGILIGFFAKYIANLFESQILAIASAVFLSISLYSACLYLLKLSVLKKTLQ